MTIDPTLDEEKAGRALAAMSTDELEDALTVVQEQTYLLQEVERLAPPEWKVSNANKYQWLTWWVPTGEYDRELPPNPYVTTCELVLHDDMRSAAAIIAMLDAMEKAGWEPELYPFQTAKEGVVIGLYDCLCTKGDEQKLGVGSTRAEAVAKAFLRVLGSAH